MADLPIMLCDLCGGAEGRLLLSKNGASYLECQTCGFIFTDQGIEDSTAANMDYFAETVADYVRRSYAPKKQKAYARKLRVFRPFRRLGTLVEVGANVGGFVHQAEKAGWQAVGVEPSEICARYAVEDKGLDVRCGFLEELGLETNAFDAVYSNAVFEHLPKPSVVFAEVARILRPGGAAWIDTVNWDSYTRRNIGADWKLIDPRVHLCLYTPETMRRYCEMAGLEVLRIETHGVRFRPNHAPRLSGIARLAEEIRKLPWSAATRFTLKGDSIAVLARKL